MPKSPRGYNVQPSSSRVQFILALLRAIEVVTQFDSSSVPPRDTGTTWSIVAPISQ
jgi:hypothetical protein